MQTYSEWPNPYTNGTIQSGKALLTPTNWSGEERQWLYPADLGTLEALVNAAASAFEADPDEIRREIKTVTIEITGGGPYGIRLFRMSTSPGLHYLNPVNHQLEDWWGQANVVVKSCVDCPFAGALSPWTPVCDADRYIFGSGGARSFGGRTYPETPPEWCPLRDEAIDVSLKDREP